jgi:hypothetical protein
MKRRLLVLFGVVVISLAITGCASTGIFPSSNITEVQLSNSNFKIVARDVSGEAEAGYLLGTTYSIGMTTATFALIRIDGTGMLYKEALEQLWKNYESKNGPVEGKRLALVNVRYDSDAINTGVYTKAKIIVRADIVEFGE